MATGSRQNRRRGYIAFLLWPGLLMDLKLSPEESVFRDEVRAFLAARLPADLREQVLQGRRVDERELNHGFIRAAKHFHNEQIRNPKSEIRNWYG